MATKYRITIHGNGGKDVEGFPFSKVAVDALKVLNQAEGKLFTLGFIKEENDEAGVLGKEAALSMIQPALEMDLGPERAATLYFLGFITGKKLD